jgi:hypothetical protein
LNKKHFEQALKAKDEMKAQGFEDVQIKVHTVDIYKKSFTFP